MGQIYLYRRTVTISERQIWSNQKYIFTILRFIFILLKIVVLSRISVFKKIAQNSYTGGFRGEKSRGTKIFEK